MEHKRSVFLQGYRHGIPIGLGYLAVSFSLGITARNCGFNALQGFLASFTTYASAGQYIGFTLYAANTTLLQLIIMTLITNARYLLMGAALNQRIPEGTPLPARILSGICITDEIFGITIARPGYVSCWYMLGALLCAMPLWSIGTALGIVMGNLLPLRLVSALSVALYGMFLAVIIPPSRKDKMVGIFVLISFLCSYLATKLPWISELSAGNRVILLTAVISTAAAIFFPRTNNVNTEVEAHD